MWKACQRFKVMRGNTISFQIGNTTAVAHLLKKGGTHCKTLNGLARKTLLKYHKDRVMVHPKYLRGMANLQTDTHPGARKLRSGAGGSSKLQIILMMGFFSGRSVCKQTLTQGASILQPGSLRQGGGYSLKEMFPKDLRYVFPPPNIILLVLCRLVRWERGPDHEHTLLAR